VYPDLSPATDGSGFPFPADLIRLEVESLRNLVRIAREFIEHEVALL
jgi:hypothetical protein